MKYFFLLLLSFSALASDLTTDGFSACLIDQNQQLRCWGEDIHERAVPSENIGKVKSFMANAPCAINDNDEITCWGKEVPGGQDRSFLKTPTNLGKVLMAQAGLDVRCALSTDHEVKCWGQTNMYLGGYHAARVPSNLGQVQSLAVGNSIVCAINADSLIRCWGGMSGTVDGRHSHLNGDGIFVDAPHKYQQVFMGQSRLCAQDLDSKLKCWEFTGLEEKLVVTNAPVEGKVLDGSLSYNSQCFIDSENELKCSGPVALTQPTDLGKVAKVVLGGQNNACVLLTNGNVHCWGDANTNKSVLTLTPDKAVGITSIKGSSQHICAQWDSGKFQCFGEIYKLGDEEIIPKPENFKSKIVDYDIANYHACVVTENNKIECWGMNFRKQMDTPSFIKNPSSIVVSSDSTCVLEKDSQASCWGLYVSRQERREGVRFDYSVTVPNRVPKLKLLVGGSYNHYCGIDFGSKVWCWGNNSNGQINVPNNLGKVKTVAAGNGFTCAILENESIKCWGKEEWQNKIPSTLTAVDLKIRDAKACAVNKNQELSCWGTPGPGMAMPPVGTGPVDWISVTGKGPCAMNAEGRLRCWGSLVQ